MLRLLMLRPTRWFAVTKSRYRSCSPQCNVTKRKSLSVYFVGNSATAHLGASRGMTNALVGARVAFGLSQLPPNNSATGATLIPSGQGGPPCRGIERISGNNAAIFASPRTNAALLCRTHMTRISRAIGGTPGEGSRALTGPFGTRNAYEFAADHGRVGGATHHLGPLPR